ncbi:hypothetical protein, conserved [Trypanosoma brucei gambiense DAL972]|uniref:Uncharacterized protein n=1 Tax=Trypanosoma brucei gambiense (strain MHOM/CI/86/DAL972) TaxID=679716 RepID=C9ZLA4_TRYB9|nr:hypothetical protein, conserved [Trypanosoma brucei gambiense DAL972]CBH10113.1 hypothetical protein, conserved [Trypanosoma brucei gambiense DAL972]|eukprot:XP_011772403.1 hypothetical protein, conserved [Trypanosoma brucei gambiense DAL972]
MVRRRPAASKKQSVASSNVKPPVQRHSKKVPSAAAPWKASGRQNSDVMPQSGKRSGAAGAVGVQPSPVGKQQPRGNRLHILPTAPEVNLWRGMCRPAILVQSLANIGTLVEVDQLLPFMSGEPRFPFSALTEDRLLVAVQALVDATWLLQPTIYVENGLQGDRSLTQNNGVPVTLPPHQRWRLVRKLVELSEAAVPMKFSILLTHGGRTGTINSTASELLPTSPCALRRRLECLRRLQQMREFHLRLVPALRRVGTKGEVAKLLFGPTAGQIDFVEPMPEVSAMRQGEQDVVRNLLEKVNECVPCGESWGSPFVMPLRISSGAYILQKYDRAEALSRLLHVAEFFGLPPFLRSIRVSDGRQRPFIPHLVAKEDDSHSIGRLPPSLYFSPSDLDPHHYDVSGSGQEQVVQEELMDLAGRHCCFGVLTGEADQVISLLRTSASIRQQMKNKKNAEVKVEEIEDVAVDDGAAARSEVIGVDPLASHAAAIVKGWQKSISSGSRKEAHVHWLCNNRWNQLTSYYAIVLMVVLPHGCEVEEKEGATEERDITTFYYVAAVCELTRQ